MVLSSFRCTFILLSCFVCSLIWFHRDCLMGASMSYFVYEACKKWPKSVPSPCEGRHAVCGKAWDLRQKEQKVSKHPENLEIFIQQILSVSPESVCLVLGTNTAPDVVSVSIPVSYTSNCSQPMNLSWAVIFSCKYFTYFLLVLGQHIWKVLDFLSKVWGPSFSQRSFEKGCCRNWRNVQYFKNGRSDSEEAWRHRLVLEV